MSHAESIRYLLTLATMLDSERALAEWRHTSTTLQVSQHLAERIASACEHAAAVLATLPEVGEDQET